MQRGCSRLLCLALLQGLLHSHSSAPGSVRFEPCPGLLLFPFPRRLGTAVRIRGGRRSCPARIPGRALAAARIELRIPSKHICDGLRVEGWGWGAHKPVSLNPEVGSGRMAKLPGACTIFPSSSPAGAGAGSPGLSPRAHWSLPPRDHLCGDLPPGQLVREAGPSLGSLSLAGRKAGSRRLGLSQPRTPRLGALQAGGESRLLPPRPLFLLNQTRSELPGG